MNLAFERLEGRVLLAASVTKQGSTLFIVGDADDDMIDVTGNGNGNVSVAVDGDTPNDYSGVKNIRISTYGGEDNVTFTDLDISGGVTAFLGDGDDTLAFDGTLNVGRNVVLSMEAGDDTVTFDPTLNVNQSIGHNLVVGLGDAATSDGDLLTIVGSESTHLDVGGGLSVVGFGGSQNVSIDQMDVHHNLRVILGDGDDSVELGLASAANEVTVGGSAKILLGNGDDSLDLANGSIGRLLTADGGFGDDYGNELLGTFDVGGRARIRNFESGNQS